MTGIDGRRANGPRAVRVDFLITVKLLFHRPGGLSADTRPAAGPQLFSTVQAATHMTPPPPRVTQQSESVGTEVREAARYVACILLMWVLIDFCVDTTVI